MPWGTHLCQFYRTREDLLEVLVPYFKAGLERNEQCLWVASPPLPAAEARDALRAALPSFNALSARGQIEIIDHTQLYLRSGELGEEAVLVGWLERERAALRSGYDGLRVSGNASFLDRKGWSSFAEYEASVHAAFHDRRILALCSYPLDRCSSSELLDVLRCHRFALVRDGRGWKPVQSAVVLLEAAHRHLARVQRVTSALCEAATLADIGRVVRTEVIAATEATSARVAVAMDGGQLEVLRGHVGPDASPRSLAEPAPLRGGAPYPLAEAYRTGAPVWLTSPERIAERYPEGPPGLSAVVALPLVIGRRRCGAIALELSAPRELTTADRALFDDIARQLALAVDRARLYQAAEAARASAEQANRTKDEFLAMLGHELRNPLSPILTALELMRLRLGDTALKERSIIERQTRHMVRLVDDLLDVSRITRGTLELSRQEIDLAEVVARAIELSLPVLEQRAHRLTTSVLDRGLLVDADPHRLAQAVANLLINAAKYTPDGGHIEVRATVSEGRVRLAIRDDGVGIDAALLPRIFDLFVQGRQALDRATGGLGLGLCIVRRLVELHGGSVTAHSDGPGRGSTFTVELPLIAAARRAGEAASGGAPRVGGRRADRRSATTPRRILIVDDNRDAASMLAEALEMFGHEICVAHDGPSALAVTEQFRPEVALLDIGLPVMDGFELAQHLRAHAGASRPTLIAVTGYGRPADCARAGEAGFDYHLTKPVDLARLASLIGNGAA